MWRRKQERYQQRNTNVEILKPGKRFTANELKNKKSALFQESVLSKALSKNLAIS